jgi:tetratricopeptide (TPR) repeat protein
MLRYVIPLFLGVLMGCGGAVPVQKDEAFAFAVEAVQDESFVTGARAAWSFIDAADPDDPRYDRGLKLLAVSSEHIGMTWAAGMIYRQIAQTRRNMEIVPEAIKGLERIIQSNIYDDDALVVGFLASDEFGDLPSDVQAFVDYQHGLDLARRGAYEWSEERFGKLPADSLYAAQAEYVRVVRLVADGDFVQAQTRLNELSKRENISSSLLNEIERTLARLSFEEKRFVDALAHFEKLREQAPDDPEILLEMAWTHFYLGDSRKTLGLLIAMDAPVHSSYISPERYLLEALALRRLCQFGPAREAAVRLEKRYHKSLKALSSGTLPGQIPEMRIAARLRGRSRQNARLMERLELEMELLDSMRGDLGPSLSTYLKGFYKRGLDEAARREEELIGQDLDELTEELLAAREGVRLIVHELGVSLLRGRRRPAGATEKPAVDVPMTGERVFYPFDGEFWTDELDDLLVIAEDRCID